jgi:hypothetical protein
MMCHFRNGIYPVACHDMSVGSCIDNRSHVLWPFVLSLRLFVKKGTNSLLCVISEFDDKDDDDDDDDDDDTGPRTCAPIATTTRCTSTAPYVYENCDKNCVFRVER